MFDVRRSGWTTSSRIYRSKRKFNIVEDRSAGDRGGHVLPRLTRATMTPEVVIPDAALELSLEQLISALDKKLFRECTRIRSAMPPPSRSLVATLTAEVRSQKPRGNPRVLTNFLADRRSGEASQRGPARSPVFAEFATTGEPSPSRGPRILRHRLTRCRSKANRPLNPRLSILARIDHLEPQELGIDINWMETIDTYVSRTCRSSPSGCGHCDTGLQGGRGLPQCITSSSPQDLLSSPHGTLIHRNSGRRSS